MRGRCAGLGRDGKPRGGHARRRRPAGLGLVWNEGMVWCGWSGVCVIECRGALLLPPSPYDPIRGLKRLRLAFPLPSPATSPGHARGAPAAPGPREAGARGAVGPRGRRQGGHRREGRHLIHHILLPSIQGEGAGAGHPPRRRRKRRLVRDRGENGALGWAGVVGRSVP